MADVLAGLYGFLYLTLKAENLALVGGSIGLGIVLALLMYLTRRIDWYAAATDGQKQAIADRSGTAGATQALCVALSASINRPVLRNASVLRKIMSLLVM